MSYTIYKTNGLQLLTLLDGTLDTSTGLNLVGKNYINYGTVQNENFVWLLENQASDTAPLYPLTGQLWYDTSTATLKYYDGTAFNQLASAGTSSVTVSQLETRLASNVASLYAGLTANVIAVTGLITAANTDMRLYVDANNAVQVSQISAATADIGNLQANVGSFYTWANANYGSSNYSNVDVAGYLPISSVIQEIKDSITSNVSSLNYDVTDLTTIVTENSVPTNSIILWNGSVSNLPYGYILCDGTSGTPILTSPAVGVYYIKKII